MKALRIVLQLLFLAAIGWAGMYLFLMAWIHG